MLRSLVNLLPVHATHLFPPENTHPVDLAETLHLTCQRNISAYDARLIALARAFGVKLITDDAGLRKVCPDDTFSLDQMQVSQ
jgi:predicted nucleic acid-binding protein